MAERFAVQSGTYHDAATWDGGSIPGAMDDVYANGHVITISADVTAKTLRNDAGITALAGGRFQSGLASFVISADVHAATEVCLRLRYGGVLIGNSYGGSASNAHGCVVEMGGIQNGDSYAGVSSYANGSYLSLGGTQNGNSHGGANANAIGSSVISGGVQNGDSYGGSNASAIGSDVLFGGLQNGTSYGGSNASAFGTRVRQGGTLICKGVTDDAAAAVRVDDDSRVALRNGVTLADLLILGTRVEIGEDIASLPFLESTDETPNRFESPYAVGVFS